MKNSKFLSVRKGYLAALALAVVFGAVQFGGNNFVPKFLQANVPGYSIPVDVNYSSFGCKAGGSWADTVWCNTYGSTYDLHVTEANKHSGTIVMFKRTGSVSGGFGLPNYGDYYVTGNYGSSAVGKNGQSYSASTVVKCPAGATMQYHAKTHHYYSPSLGEGFYDGSGHYWCDLNGAAVDPEKFDGRQDGVQLPDSDNVNMDKLYPIYFPGNIVKYKKIGDSSSYYKCNNGYEGPYEPGVNQYLNMYFIKESAKKNYYRCLTADGSGFEAAVSDGTSALMTTSTGQVNISSSLNNLSDAINCNTDYTSCQPSCAAGDSSCGGAGTYVTGATKCASNTYIFQTEESLTRYCASSPTTGTFIPPTTYGAKIIHVNYATSGDTVFASVGGTVTIAPGAKNYYPWLEIKNTSSVSDTYTFSHSITSSDNNVSSGKIKDCIYTVNDLPVTSLTIAAGASEKVRLQCNIEAVDPNGVILTSSLAVKSQVQNKTLGSYTYSITTKKKSECSLNIQLNDNKTNYNQGDMVNYSYYCSPTGTTAATTYVYVVKPDGTSTLYTSGTNSSAVTLGFSTSNLSAGSHTLKVCLNSTCTNGVASVNFTVAGSTVVTCPSGQYWSGTACVNNSTTCTAGQTWDSTKGMCISSDWKEVIWNTLGLKSYVSINTPQTVIDEAKKACANTKPENASWPNPSDFTKPATVGVPSCNGTVVTSCNNNKICDAGENSSSCPGDCSTLIVTPCNFNKYCDANETAGTCPLDCGTGTTPRQCEIGGKCAAGSWCNNGKQCYYPDGSLTCAAWTMSGNNSCAVAAPGTKECSPDDTNCIEPGATGSLSGWCKNSMECFTGDGSKKFCQAYSNDMNKPTMCPAGSKLCGANDKSCGEPDTEVPLTSWCKNSMECYSKDGTKKFCQSFQMGLATVATGMSNMSCPAEYPKECKPDNKDCTEVGESNTNPGAYCAPGGKQCYKDGGLLCVDEGASCPKDSKKCPTNIPVPLPYASSSASFYSPMSQCIEDEGPIDGWCGGSSTIQCYNKNGKTKKCIEVDFHKDPQAWENVACPADYDRCAPNSPGCLGYLGAKGKREKGDWCAVGMTKDNGDGTITCVSGKDFIGNPMPIPGPGPIEVWPVPGVPEVCAQVITVAYNPKTYECKTFSSACSAPKDWTKVTGQICVNGKLSDIDVIIDDDQDLREFVNGKMQYLRDIALQIKTLPPVAQGQGGVAALSKVVDEWQKIFKDLSKKLPVKNKDDRKYVEQQLDVFQNQALSEIENKLEDSRSYMDYMVLEREVVRDLAKAADELKEIDPSSEYYANLKAAKSKLEGLLKSAQGVSGQALGQIVESIKTAKYEIADLFDKEHKGKIGDFLSGTIEDLNTFRDKLADLTAERTVEDKQNLIPKFQKILNRVNEIKDSDSEELINMVDEGVWIKGRLEAWLFPNDVNRKKISIETLFENLDKRIAEKVDEALAKLSNKLEIMLDESMQKITVKMTEVLDRTAEKLSVEFASRFTQSLGNLTAAPEEHKDTIVAAKENILESIESIDAAIEKDGTSSFTENNLMDQMERMATYSWCGEMAETVQAKINSLGLALEAGELDASEVTELPEIVDNWARENNEECYKIGASNFRDVPMHDWYYGSAQWNSNNGYIKGYGGDKEGQYGAGDATLKIEALAMLMRMFNLPTGNELALEVSVGGVPDWGYGYVNGAKDFIDLGWKWNEPISRLESAKLIRALLKITGDYVEPVGFDSIRTYGDYSVLNKNSDAASAIEALTDAGIFKGAGDGNFYPNSTLVRSEFGALNQRLFEAYLEDEAVSNK